MEPGDFIIIAAMVFITSIVCNDVTKEINEIKQELNDIKDGISDLKKEKK